MSYPFPSERCFHIVGDAPPPPPHGQAPQNQPPPPPPPPHFVPTPPPPPVGTAWCYFRYWQQSEWGQPGNRRSEWKMYGIGVRVDENRRHSQSPITFTSTPDLGEGSWTAAQGSVNVMENVAWLFFNYRGALFEPHMATVTFRLHPTPGGVGEDYMQRKIHLDPLCAIVVGPENTHCQICDKRKVVNIVLGRDPDANDWAHVQRPN